MNKTSFIQSKDAEEAKSRKNSLKKLTRIEEYNFPNLEDKSVGKASISPIKSSVYHPQQELKNPNLPILPDLDADHSSTLEKNSHKQDIPPGVADLYNQISNLGLNKSDNKSTISGKLSPLTTFSKTSKTNSRHRWLKKVNEGKKSRKKSSRNMKNSNGNVSKTGMSIPKTFSQHSFKRVLEDFKRFGINEDDSDDTDFGNTSNEDLSQMGNNPLDDDQILALDDEMVDDDYASLPDSKTDQTSQITGV